MSDLYSQRKIVCPALPAVHLHREALVQKFRGIIDGPAAEPRESFSPYRLILLHAPAGYGKTTLLVDYSHHTNLPCCWYILNHTDTDRMTFFTTLLMSIRECFPDFGLALDPLFFGAPSEHANNPKNVHYFETVLEALVTAIETEISERFALLLCNYQEINDYQEMNDLINLLLQRLPVRCVLVIESRVIPDLDFAQFLANQMIYGIGTSQLRFTGLQIQELAHLQGVGSLKQSEADQLALTFDGWIAGILLGTRLGNLNLQQFQRNLPLSPTIDVLEPQVASQYLFSYVVNEVFKSHQEAYTFLKGASVLQEMAPAMCAALLDVAPSEASAHLQYLEQYGLFVTHSGEGSEILYTCTPVLRKLFYDDLRREAPAYFSHLHQRAAELLSASHNYSQAIHHALEASVDEIAAGLIIESSEQMMNQGHAETLVHWIDAFPLETTNKYPKLLVIRANIYLRQGNYGAARLLLDAADVSLRTLLQEPAYTEKHLLPILQAEVAIARSRVLFQDREYQQGQLLCQQVLESLPADEVTLRAEAHMRLGLCHILLGDFTPGIAQVQKALQLWGRYTIRRQTADGHGALATAYSLMGNFALAEHHSARAIACWDHLQDSWGKTDNLVRLGYIKMRQGAFLEAEALAQEALALTKDSIYSQRGRAYALSSLGAIHLYQERYELALALTEEALDLARLIDDGYLVGTVLCDLSMIYLYMGDTATAMMLISEVEIQAGSGDPIGYKRVVRDLVYGTIYLYQHQYESALSYLSECEIILQKIGLKQELLQTLLRLAACYVVRKHLTEANRLIERATTIISISEGYEQFARIEIHHLPGMLPALKRFPEMAWAREAFHIEPEFAALPLSVEVPPAVLEPLPPPAPPEPPTQSGLAATAFTVRIQALGEPAVLLYEEPITRWRMARAMELCFYLLDCGRPMRKESIITALWPEADEQTTRTFYSTIYYLRQALGGEAVIVAKGGTYTLRLDALYGDQVTYDVAVFEEYQTKARIALEHENDTEAKTACQAMVDLYRGDYVQPFYNDWCTLRRDELRRAYLEARHQLAQIAWRADQFDESIVHWQQMLAVDNCLEEAHYGLMRCYARQGKRGLALRQYQRCKTVMEQEFGAQPRASIQNLYQRLMGSL